MASAEIIQLRPTAAADNQPTGPALTTAKSVEEVRKRAENMILEAVDGDTITAHPYISVLSFALRTIEHQGIPTNRQRVHAAADHAAQFIARETGADPRGNA